MIFGVTTVVLFAVVAVASGIGRPSVPPDAIAVVSDMPDGKLTITEEQFDRALKQMAAQAQIKKVPDEDDPQYKDLALAAVNDLLDVAWIQGEAADHGITVSDRQIEDQLKQVAQQNFQCDEKVEPFECKELKAFLKDSHYSQEEVTDRIEVGLLSNELQTAISKDQPKPTTSQLKAYYNTFQSQFLTPATTDLRLIQTEKKGQAEQAKAALEKDANPENWEKVAKKYSTDPASKDAGGLREGVTSGMFEEQVEAQIDEAEPGKLVGPIKADSGFYLIQVEQRNPEKMQSFDEVHEQLEQQVSQQLLASQQTAFINNYRNVWTSRTVCAEGFMTDRCVNADGVNDFESAEAAKAAAEATKDKAPVMAEQVVWPKPPDTLTLPIDPVTASGTQIVCNLAEKPEGQAIPLTGTAPPQRPHPAGSDEEINKPPEGQEAAAQQPTCGAVDPTAGLGGLQLGQ